MSKPVAPRMSPAVFAGLMETRARIGLARETAEPKQTVPAPAPISSYEVRIRPGIGDTIFLVGHDRAGEPMVEVRMKRRHLKPASVRRMERWCRDHDDAPELKLA